LLNNSIALTANADIVNTSDTLIVIIKQSAPQVKGENVGGFCWWKRTAIHGTKSNYPTILTQSEIILITPHILITKQGIS
jgi:hypothetical protein